MSARKDRGMWLLVVCVLAAVVMAFIYVIFPNLPQSKTSLQLGDGIFHATIAASNNARDKGLSGVSELAVDQALLMVFPSDGKWGIWMKDMKIPIDIVWLNSDKKVVYIVKNAPPEGSTSVPYTPKTPAKYVIELPTGTVDGKAIGTNATAVFTLNTKGI
jgi:uncharacterized membrane protein (UPF0127 family)